MEDVCTFYGRLVYHTAIWYFCGHLVYFSPFWYFLPRKIWQPWLEAAATISENYSNLLVNAFSND
jgi:hypothetical protein